MTKRNVHHPIRTCVSCSKKKNKDELIRLSLDQEGNLFIDISGSNMGRGVYICDSATCRERLKKNRSLNRRFRTDKVITIGTDLMN